MKFVTIINFTEQGLRNISATTDRATAFAQQAEKAGIKVIEMLWLGGRFDGLLVYEAPDFETASGAMLNLSMAGNVRTETIPAFDTGQMRSALEKL